MSKVGGFQGIAVIVIVILAVLLNRGVFGTRGRGVVGRAMRPALLLGGIGFAAGFFGPMILAPDANQGPLLSSSLAPAASWWG